MNHDSAVSAERSAGHRRDQPLRELQRLFLIERRFVRKEVAARMKISVDTVDRWGNGVREVPASMLPALYYGLGRYTGLWACLLQDTDLLVMHRPQVVIRRGVQRVMQELLLQFGQIYQIFGKLLKDTPLTAEEEVELEQEIQTAKATLDEALELARQRRREGEGKI